MPQLEMEPSPGPEVVPVVLMVSGPEEASTCSALAALLRQLLPDWRISQSAKEGMSGPPESDASAVVLILGPSRQFRDLGLSSSVMGTLSRLGDTGWSAVFPVLLPAARMPLAADLPEILRWLEHVNAIRGSSDDLRTTALRIASAITDQATLAEPMKPTSLLWSAFRASYRSMGSGIVGALIAVAGSFAIVATLVLAVPWLREGRRLGALGLGMLWVSGVVSGALGGRRSAWGVLGGAAVGAVLPWTPLMLSVVVALIPQLLYFWMSRTAPNIAQAFWSALFGAPLGVIIGFISAARFASGRGVPTSRTWIFRSLAFATVGAFAGGLIGWEFLQRSGPFAAVLVLLCHTVAAGVLNGFATGFGKVVGDRRRLSRASRHPIGQDARGGTADGYGSS